MPDINEAMDAERPEKGYVRAKWGEIVYDAYANWHGPEYLYLTLPGAKGRDIDVLMKLGILEKMENGVALKPSEEAKIYAVERRTAAYTELREKFPGLGAFHGSIEELAGGATDMTIYPGKKDKIRNALRARVVNLDYNGPLALEADDHGIHFPQLNLVLKLAQIHGTTTPPIDWTLLLTLNSGVSWPAEAHKPVQDYLAENMGLHEVFAEMCAANVGEALCEKLMTSASLDFAGLSVAEQRFITAVLVPKKIATLVHNQGWRTQTEINWQYGGEGEAAPMCTWVIRFRWDRRSSSQPNAVYEESIGSIFDEFGSLALTDPERDAAAGLDPDGRGGVS